ncbi:hypothetical protein [Vibrio spartinae]|uniref:Uncharacterized protein n=1 Tax=Vibrio spartinae TaxID=1918945 RepID=A0A1N6MAN2_9VIBR|nr:hypothetical protein [Vibrio spartinae]QMV16690.1 hypothetical protein Vspart_04086 [Vibrio spartinae]SIO96512.1 hypothetical protein VSP9026_04301 [Vibrio spartinae]
MGQPAILIIACMAVFFGVIMVRTIWLAYLYQKKIKQDVANIQLTTSPTAKSIFSGTTPHEMSGEIALILQRNIQLPDAGWTAIEPPAGLIDNIIQAANGERCFSALSYQSAVGKGILQSWRIDCVKPDEAHVSQAIRDGEKYALDEWISLGQHLFVNTGLWFDIEDQAQIRERLTFNQHFMPEHLATGLPAQQLEYIGRATIHHTPYLFLRMAQTPPEHNTSVSLQLWLDAQSLRLQKSRLIIYENDQISAEEVTVYTRPQETCAITAPDWINVDHGAVTNRTVCVVEHW